MTDSTIRCQLEPDVPAALDDPAWDSRPARVLVDVGTGVQPAWTTDMRIAASDRVLAVHYTCRAGSVLATMTRYKDKVWQEDAVEVYLRPPDDPFLYEFQLSPIGTCRDLRVAWPDRDDRAYDDSWSCAGMRTAAAIDRDHDGTVVGWRALFEIPWRSMGSRPSNTRPWRLAVFRVERQPFERSGLRSCPAADLDLHDPRLQVLLVMGERSPARADCEGGAAAGS